MSSATSATSPRPATRLDTDAEALAAATPADRDRVVDVVRVAALATVAVGHWLLAVVEWDDGGLHGRNLLVVAPWTRWATWVLQVMPLFFVVGGVANAASWASARRRATGWAAWLHGRVDRLVRPVAALVVTWTAALAVAAAFGADPAGLRTASRLVAMPLWFLAVYLGVVAATPAMVALHDRFGWRVSAGLAVAAGAVDVIAGPLGRPAVGWVNFAFVWLFAHQLGFSWRDGRLDGRRAGLACATVGLGGLIVLTQALGYPLGMVGAPGERSNTTPPTLALVALTVGQTGLLLLARRRVADWAARPRAWRAVVAANGVAMTVFLWHLTALCIATLVFLPTGLLPQPEPATAAWWMLRPAWLLALVALTAALIVVFGRVETAVRPPRPARPGRAATVRAVAGAALVSAGLAIAALYGFPVAGRPLLLPVLALVLVTVGVVSVRSSLLRRLAPPAARSQLRPILRRRPAAEGRANHQPHWAETARAVQRAASASRPQSSTVSSSARASGRTPARSKVSAAT